jgi:transposase InsO family protein
MGKPIKSTGQVLHILPELLAKITKWDHKVYFTWADNGATFKSFAFKQLCDTNGIELSFSAPYSPHQNALAERPWRILAEMARCLLSTAGLPRSYWEIGFKHAIFIHNRTYRARVAGIPITLALDIIPYLNTTKIFGCKSYVNVDDALRRKLDDKAWEGILWGIHLILLPG